MDVEQLLNATEHHVFVIDPSFSRQRLDTVLAARLRFASRARVQSWIHDGDVLVDGVVVKKSSRVVHAGQSIAVTVTKTRRDLDVSIDDLLELPVAGFGDGFRIIVKPGGVLSHPAGGAIKRTVLTAVALAWKGEYEAGGPWLPHRLDRETSGLLVIALSKAAEGRFVRAFAEGRIQRVYRALVRGTLDLPLPFDVDAPLQTIGQKPERMGVVVGGLPSVTRILRLVPRGHMTEVILEPITGRQHQLRVHLLHLGHPVVDDPLYDPKARPNARMMLHAERLVLPADVALTSSSVMVEDEAPFA